MLNCYEIEQEDLVTQIQQCNNDEELEKLFEEYVKQQNVNN